MLTFLKVLLISLSLVNAAENGNQFRLLGGYRPPRPSLAKHVVSLRRRTAGNELGEHFCGGTILSPRTILTTASCIIRPDVPAGLQPGDFFISAGSTMRLAKQETTQLIEVESIRTHPEYLNNSLKIKNDIAVLRLKTRIVEDGVKAKRIALASERTKSGTPCTVIGWGRVVPNGFNAAEATYLDLETISNSRCRKLLDFSFVVLMKLRTVYVRKTTICAVVNTPHLEGTCEADSGGPLICDDALVGVLSFGACGAGVTVFTRVLHFEDWIEENDAIQIAVAPQRFQLLMALVVIVFSYYL